MLRFAERGAFKACTKDAECSGARELFDLQGEDSDDSEADVGAVVMNSADREAFLNGSQHSDQSKPMFKTYDGILYHLGVLLAILEVYGAGSSIISSHAARVKCRWI